MTCSITLTVTTGKLAGKKYTFDSRSTCIIGRSEDCNLQIADDIDMTISRYHCLLDINPPKIRIRDFGSLNGTYVNGEKIGQRQPNQTPEKARKIVFPEYDLTNSDRFAIGNIVFDISIQGQLANQPEPGKNKPNFFKIIQNLFNLANTNHENTYKNLQSIANYHIVHSLGQGDCGEVFLVKHIYTKKLLTLKLMLPQAVDQSAGVKMFLREIENTKCLQHPHVVQLLDYGFVENIFFFTMEYCDCGDVYQLMQEYGGYLPVNIAIPIILQVLDGLTYAHNVEVPYVLLADGTKGKGKGLVHRDLKPSNIFLANVNGKMIAKIGGYGLAKAFDLAGLSGQTLTGTKAGTPAFMCRQQLIDYKRALPEVDVWAAAASLYCMLTGDVPRDFVGDPFSCILKNDIRTYALTE
ncbi:FHA domain-containing protein [Anabaena sp. FACHB-1237]|uniref:protein kinase domain-containing protein n=1 Tax=Anabaena sp. FACHB-1237 TaxID=2692769 RepID=UPI001680EB98|nr:protein kinase [Anabaena sp. FACHB-1237]MBD2139460.1 FHA domain-containing protein [Anabaena sp. FACHB-1237]